MTIPSILPSTEELEFSLLFSGLKCFSYDTNLTIFGGIQHVGSNGSTFNSSGDFNQLHSFRHHTVCFQQT
ncbi:hypothetical protein TNIN_377281 [Trichonephila inaurata madagascariensis]|uniref:Uncharacterized protein n=1 Tax=Trichonephila inaurata madagascariensis TaxID=2747483 RepID=A0A8X6WXG8_9ARAC|nr:hypothetical protein TNIN_377281 [Trichonephila inaurata madagascariensis]